MKTLQLGNHGASVSAIGLGCMAMSGIYGQTDDEESIATIHAALDAGINLIDTGDFYGMGTNEMLVRRALEGRPRDEVVLSVKFGSLRGPDGTMLGFDASPRFLKTFLSYSLRRLGTDYVDIYRPARLGSVPIEDTAGAIAELIEAGYVRQMGLSEIGAETLRRANAVTPIADLQIEYSLISRGIEREILSTARELGIPITAYGILSRGLLSGQWSPERGGARDFRSRMPRFSGANAQQNLELVEKLRSIADASGVTVAQLAIAWVASRGDDVIPLLGSKRRDQLEEALAGAQLELTPAQLEQIEAVCPADAAAGTRYPDAQMAVLDSER